MRTYRKTLRGRLDDLLRGLRERSRRAAAGSIAVIIGALGATALLATTLVLPDAPLQRIFAMPSGGDLDSHFGDTQSEDGGGTEERTIEVDTRTSEDTNVLGSEGRGPELAGDQVLGTVLASGSSGPALVTSGADAGGTNGGDGSGAQESQTGSTSGSGSGSEESPGSGEGSGSNGTVPATKPEDDERDDDERDDDRRPRDDSDSGGSDSRDSRADNRGSGSSRDSDDD